MSVRFRLRDAAGMLHPPTSQDSKYTRGVVGLMTGSERYPGAGVLSASAALRAGAGYVRYVGPDVVARLLLARHPEAVIGRGRADCWVIGSGLPGLGTGARADQMRALLDPAALLGGDDDVADLLEGLEPSGAVDGAAAPAIRVVDAGALVDFGALMLAARRRGLGPEAVDHRPGDGTEATDDTDDTDATNEAGARPDGGSDDPAAARAQSGRRNAAGAGAPDPRRRTSSAHRYHQGRIQTASAARLTPAVRREGFSPFPESSNLLINRGGSPAQDASADGGRGGSPLDPAAFWQIPQRGAHDGAASGHEVTGTGRDAARQSDRDAARQSGHDRAQSGHDRAAAGYDSAPSGSAGPGSTEFPEKTRGHVGRGDRASRSRLQLRLEDARRGHSHPLPGVLAGNMVGVSGKETDTVTGFGTGRTVRTGMTGRTNRMGRTAATARMTGFDQVAGDVPAGVVRTAGTSRRARRGTGNRKLYVITPHTGELARLMSSLGEGAVNRGEIESDRRGWAQKAADRLGCVVVLKGAHTFVAAPGAALLEVVAPTYWLSTAGTGDVLAGTLGTVLAQLHADIVDGRTDLQHAVALGVYLHGYAGGIASGVIPAVCPHPLTAEPLGMAGGSELVGHPLLAMDVASALPSAVHAVLEAAGSMGPALPPRR